MTASGTEEPTIGIDQIAALTVGRACDAAVTTDDAGGMTWAVRGFERSLTQ
jgi:hypothetical protein